MKRNECTWRLRRQEAQAHTRAHARAHILAHRPAYTRTHIAQPRRWQQQGARRPLHPSPRRRGRRQCRRARCRRRRVEGTKACVREKREQTHAQEDAAQTERQSEEKGGQKHAHARALPFRVETNASGRVPDESVTCCDGRVRVLLPFGLAVYVLRVCQRQCGTCRRPALPTSPQTRELKHSSPPPRLHHGCIPVATDAVPAAEPGHAPYRFILSVRVPSSGTCSAGGARRRSGQTACHGAGGTRPGSCSRAEAETSVGWVTGGGLGACPASAERRLASRRSGPSEALHSAAICHASPSVSSSRGMP